MKKLLFIFFLLPVFCLAQNTLTLQYPEQQNEDTVKSKTARIDNIFLRDRIVLLIGSNGCFHSVSVEYIFNKKSTYFEVSYTKKYNPKHKAPQCSGKIKLSNEKVEAIHQLCIYGLTIKQRGCTTRVDFELSTKDKKVAFEDNRCAGDDDIMNKIGEIVGVCKDF